MVQYAGRDWYSKLYKVLKAFGAISTTQIVYTSTK